MNRPLHHHVINIFLFNPTRSPMASIGSGKKNMMNSNDKHYSSELGMSKTSVLKLKDYLMRDDLSSCSSNGFKSFPRRQCCTTVRLDLQRASMALISAIKSLPGAKSKKSHPTCSLSRTRSFWRKQGAKEERKWRTSFRELLMLDEESNKTDFTFSSSSAETDALPKQDWANEDVEKEQFSPVSILDCPFEEDDDSNLNSISNSLSEGSKPKKDREKRRDLKTVGLVELEKRMRWSEQDDEAENARELVKLVMKRAIPSNNCWVENKEELCQVAEEWIRGEEQEVHSSWEMKEGREWYIREMEKCAEWKTKYTSDHQQVALDLENELFTSLLFHLLLDLAMC